MPRRRKAIMLLGAVALPCVLAVMSGPVASASPQSGTTAAGQCKAEITGSGSSWAANAVNEWVGNIYAQGVAVSFTPDGSAAGRIDYADKTVDFAVSDIGYQGYDPVTQTNDVSSRPYAYLPVTAGGTSFPYNIKVGGKQVANLRLSGKTLAEIFTNKITNWDDPAITKDNNGRKLPNIPIITVVPSEGSGTTAQFTLYLNRMFPALWKAFNNGHPGFTEYWPRQGASQVAMNSSTGVMNYISSASANGAIGFDEYSYALSAGFPVINLENAAGYYVLPSQWNDAVALTKAVINTKKSSKDYLLENLNNVYTNPDKRAYPLSSYSYTIMPVSKTDPRMAVVGNQCPAKWQSLADFLYYSICQGQGYIGPSGYSSLPVNLVEAGFAQIDKIKAAAPGVQIGNQNIYTCHNPTFVPGHPNENSLAQNAPQPPSCDKAGNGPCPNNYNANGNGGKGSSTPKGGGKTGSGSGNTPGSGSSSSPPAGASNSPSSGPSSGTSSAVNPVTGQPSGTSGNSGTNGNVASATTDLAAGQGNGLNDMSLGILAGLLLLAILVIPPFVARRLSSRGRQW